MMVVYSITYSAPFDLEKEAGNAGGVRGISRLSAYTGLDKRILPFFEEFVNRMEFKK